MNNVTSFEENPLSLLSTQQIVLQANKTNAVTLADGTLDVRVDTLQASYNNVSYLSLTQSEAVLNSAKTIVTSPAGMVVNGSVQTNSIANAHATGLGLTIESVAQQLTLKAAKNISLTSTDGDLTISALTGIRLSSPSSITLSAGSIVFENLPTFGGAGPQTLCVCADGRLFTVAASNSSVSCVSVPFC